MSMILRIEYDVASCKDCPLLGRDGVNYTCRLIGYKYLDFLTFDQKRDEECPLVNVESRPQGKWIETKDELPSEDYDWVVAVIREKDTGYIWLPRVMEYRKGLDDWLFQNERGWLSDEVNQGLEVVAWCPLPEPYNADMRGEE